MRITVGPYDHRWPGMFEAERARILAAFTEQRGSLIADIQHIGSTSIPGLAAKPIIDILIGVLSLDLADEIAVPAIIRLGYEYVQETEGETPFRRFFRKFDDHGNRTHHIHLIEIEHDWWLRHIAFRDYLRTHPEECAAYESLKLELAKNEWKAREDYTQAKTEFILAVEARAIRWYQAPTRRAE